MGTAAEEIRKIAGYGVMAPSGDNCQPWAFRLKGDILEVIDDRTRDTSFYNFRNTASYIAHGALLENIRIASRALGYELTEELFPDGEDGLTIAKIRFSKAHPLDEPLFPFIEIRCTNRFKYNGSPLADETRSALNASVAAVSGAGLLLAEGRAKDIAAKAASSNDRILFEHKGLHDFLFDHIRWSAKEAEAARDGMDIRTLGLDPVQQRLFPLLRSWNLLRVLNSLGLSRMLPLQSYMLCKGSSAMGLVEVRGSGPRAYLSGGSAVQRAWLTATMLGLSFQPMTGILFLLNRLYKDADSIATVHRIVLKKAEALLKEAFSLSPGSTPVMLFRIGPGKPPGVSSLRMPVVLK
ncbi:MAG TPA: nitroreductase [Deltaproteobacteria bacterium]|nr:MAG: hypothetical protein A2Z79_08900 [Deltaproteobacteria bacterium GWA2_55_82]OGQ64584.1 MAG: hypothetical protein A3I81_11165 [Deltaproteobacteria bacterium RIFCSPLOWO2_02_FULL_55_12]OIJ73682.1 MAG: hypothetical protein A2V21_305035 [Deltaproteobacteria bacterium GWC2_55_46]HBG45925.1 nitroreductase [Deltaproteobacteria bacterium]HCY09655.1 nitroreductase [Deltaproteobacteria bacterium]